MPGESLWADLEPLLERVNKPIQYVGGELNSTVKDWHVGGHGPTGEELTTRWALMYPDAYEVGVPNQGVMILYEVINEREDALAERTYAVWPDMEAQLRESGLPQFTVDGHRAVRDFDLLGLSFSTEPGEPAFYPLTIGLAVTVAIFQSAWVRTDKAKYLQLTRFFGKIFLINFAMGVVTGIVQEFQFGMNWSDYSRFVGDVFGAPLALEGLLAVADDSGVDEG